MNQKTDLVKVYFDNAATTPLRSEVVEVISTNLKETFGNPSSIHDYGRKAKTSIESARKSIAKQFNVAASEIIFTSGGTESDNMIFYCAVNDLGVQRIITSKIEHHAVLHAAEKIAKEGISLEYVRLDEEGSVDINHLEILLSNNDQTTLVSLMHINNEIGNVLNLQDAGAICKKYGAYFHTDAVQGVGHFRLDFSALPIDFLSASAHKFHGPKGIGFLYIRKAYRLKSMIKGGGQERGLRAGTEAVHNIVGMATALELAYQNYDTEHKHILEIKKYFLDQIYAVFPGAICNGLSGDIARSTYTLVNISLPIDKEKATILDFHLDLNGIACSKGSACQSGSSQVSHVINALQREDQYSDWPTLRFSFSCFNSKSEIDHLIKVLRQFADQEKPVANS